MPHPRNLRATIRYSLCAVFLTLLAGCATQPCCNSGQPTVPTTTTATHATPCNGGICPIAPRATATAPVKLLAVGYGAPGTNSQYTPGQQKLMAMRAAQVDAYRNLAEQVYGFRIWGNTAVSAFTTQNDVIRTYVEAFIRGARVVSMTSIADGNFEATVELDLAPNFLDCFAPHGNCGVRNSIPACVAPGCSAPSATYVSQ